MKFSIKTLAAAAIFGVASSAANALNIADVVVIIDESGSMGGEQAWIDDAILSLEAGLNAAGIGSGTDGVNQYALVGYGGNIGGSFDDPRSVPVGGGDWGTAADFATATGSLTTSGSFEDGYDAIGFFFDNYSVRAGAALNIILVTDEDRDVTPGSVNTYASLLSQITGVQGLLNVVVDASFAAGGLTNLLGVDSNANGYSPDGLGGYTTVGGASAVSGDGSTIADYVDLALATGGAAWDLNQLRTGGLTADSFTDAFVDIKVREITDQTGGEVPVPGTLLLMGAAFAGLGMRKRLAA